MQGTRLVKFPTFELPWVYFKPKVAIYIFFENRLYEKGVLII
jgi:hypothetical protein